MTTPKNPIKYIETDSFQKDLKRLLKKFRTLKEDLKTLKKSAIELFHLHQLDNQSIFHIPGYSTENIQIYKVKKFACKALKGKGVKSGIRVIYALDLENHQVVFIEIYFKGEQEMENKYKIEEALKKYDERVI